MREMDAGQSEQDLVAAGFQMRMADTPARTAMLQAMPAYKVMPQQVHGRMGYVYAAPNENALYVGGPAEYQKYEKISVKQEIAEENEMSSFENQMAANDWDWDAYGPFWW